MESGLNLKPKRNHPVIGQVVASAIFLGIGAVFLALCAWFVVWIISGIKALL